MRAYAYLSLFVLFLGLPFVLRMAILGRQPSRRQRDAERITIITPHNQDIRRQFQRAFGAWHRRTYGSAMQIDFLFPGGSNDVKRQLENTYARYRDPQTHRLADDVPIDIDVVWGGGDFFFDGELRPMGVLQPMRLDPALIKAAFPEETLAGVKLLDGTRDASGRPTPLWVGVCLSAFGIVYNPDLYRTLGLSEPARWHDLADPKLADLVELADPSHSGSAAMAYLMVLQRAMADAEARFFQLEPGMRNLPEAELERNPAYKAAIAAGWKRGMADLLLIAANARYFADQASTVPNDVGNGQAAAGMAIDFYGRVYQESVGPGRCKVVLPTGATAITPDPVGILHGVKGRRLELSLHFIEFLLSREGQLLWILKPGEPNGPEMRSLRRPPIRRDLYADRRGWADDVDPFEIAQGFNQRPEWSALLGDTRPIWAAAWIDTRDTLKAAYARILQVPDQSHRDELLAEMADLPISLSDVEKLREERRAAEKSGHGEEWKAENRVRWAIRFREHYRVLMAKAG